MIPVTRPFSPPIAEYQEYLKGIWQRNWYTNNGPLVNELELQLKQYLKIKHLLYLGNGTIAIQIALKALELEGEIITTPFSYVATTSSIVWEGMRPVFVDIDPETFNIDPKKIEASITDKTTGILATHCFGNPCDIKAIAEIAQRHDLKVIYDAAHCFGTNFEGKSIFHYGDISTTSLHATKLFHTIEGGAVFTENPETLRKMAYMRNFGHAGPETFQGLGINGKNSEFHAAMGLCNLKYIDDILQSRKNQAAYYQQYLSKPEIKMQKIQEGSVYNHAYFPIVLENEAMALNIKKNLEKIEVFPRRYFFPSLSSLNYVGQIATPISDDIASRILCLPMFFELSEVEQHMIVRRILRALKYQ
ncbi:DegT/DnrJ/EryC1/StrS family aminotransferase [Pararhodonellum marinum]|uniref:DegT/DnrJ/EryC1/StrS family aminotransferase n=1 Tax=Pararhodonellum marinum TaxID=2755358 RepID=UPI00188E2972|nr:DegT/DnrJ/EryC1/StrS family aminotransferase [Pararhodonellum marinum]